MPTTDQGIWYPGPDDPITPIENVFATMASSIDTNMGVRRFDNEAARDAAFNEQPFKVCVIGTDVATGTLQVYRGGTWHSLSDMDNGTYTPVLTASNTNPTGYTSQGTYRRTGNLCFTQFTIVLGSVVGDGSYAVSAPMIVNDYIPGTKPGGNFYVSAGTNSLIGMIIIGTGNPGSFTMTIQLDNWNRAIFGPGAPVPLASGHRINGSVVFGTDG